VPESWEKPFEEGLDAVRRGNFDEVKNALEDVGFKLDQTTDPNHWIYYHPRLRGDPLFRYPRHLFRAHGSRRTSDRISRHDQSQARQAIEALRTLVAATREGGGDQ
jgi:hypothetical protein